MEGRARIAPDVLASYAADAAADVAGVRGLSEGRLPGRRAVRVKAGDGGVALELHLAVDWGVSIPAIGEEVQARVAEYLERMVDIRPAVVDVVVDEIAAPR
jgi:uncharacterized alkaline shock family protein YloU